MARVTIKDPRLKTSLNPVITQLREDGWICSINDEVEGVTDDTEALVGDITRGGMTANQRTFADSTSEAVFLAKQAEKKIEIEDQLKETDAKEKNILISRMLTAETASLKREAVNNFLMEALFSKHESEEEAQANVAKIFTFYNQDMTAFVKQAISFEMQTPQVTSEEGIQFVPSVDMKKTTSDWMINEEGQLCLQTRMGIRLIDPASDEVERNNIGIEVPGEISWQFVLTPAGFKLNYIDFSNSLLQDLCLGSEKEIVLEAGLRQAARAEKGKQKGRPQEMIGNFASERRYNDILINPSLDDDGNSSSDDESDDDDDLSDDDESDNDTRYDVADEPVEVAGLVRTTLNSIYNLFISVYTMAYPPDGFDPVTKTLNGEKSNYSLASQFYFHPLTLISSFLGLPNGNPNLHPNQDEDISVQSIGNLFWRFISWDDTQAIGVNVLRAPIAAAFHLLMVVPKFVVNLAKLVTEFLPTLGAQIFGKIARTAKTKLDDYLATDEDKNFARIIGWGALYGAAKSLEMLFKTLNFVGRAITSPILNMRSAWHGGDQLGAWLANKLGVGEKTEKVIRGIIAYTFGALTGAFTVAIYTVAFPISAKLTLGTVLPNAPGILATAIKGVITVASAASSVIMPVVGPVIQGLGLSLSPLALVSAAVLSSVIGNEAAKGLKAVTSQVVGRVASWFRKPDRNEEGKGFAPAPEIRPNESRSGRRSPTSKPTPSRSNSVSDVSDWHKPSQAPSPSHDGIFAHHESPHTQEADLTDKDSDTLKPKEH